MLRSAVFLCSLFALTLVQGTGCTSNTEAGNTEEPAGPPLYQSVTADSSGLHFLNAVANTDDLNIFNYRNFYNGGGVGLIDYDRDGLTDVFLTANMGPNKLFRNLGDLRFEDVSATAGIELPNKWSTGVAVVDINADGWLDLYVCNAGFRKDSDQRNSLFLNNQDGTFTESATAFGLDNAGYTTHASFFDYDLDGDLDAYLLNNSFIPVNNLNYSNDRERNAADWNVPEFLKGGGDQLLRNDNGRFTDVTESAGIYNSLIGFGLGITVGDVNGDRYPDLYISNDFYERDYLYINQRDGTFSEEVEDRTQHISLASMGADMADLNNDGAPELFVTEMLPETDYRRKTTVQFEDVNLFDLKQRRGFYKQFMHNTLQLNDGTGEFREIAQYAGVEATDWSWGALLFDADNDGLRDIYVCNGIYHSLTDQDFIDFFSNDVAQRMVLTGEKEDVDKVIERMPSDPLPNKLYQNLGDLRFADQTVAWGVDLPSFSNGAAYGDLDNDGDLDLVVNNVNQPAMLLRNDASQQGKRSLQVKLVGTGQNTFAVGSNVSFRTAGGRTQSAELIPTRGFQSSVDYTLTFGLGDGERPRELQVVWPDGTESLVPVPDSARVVTLHQDSVAVLPSPAPAAAQKEVKLFERVSDTPFASHEEDNFSDLLIDGLVIRTLTREGPRLAVADVNGDGLEDVFIGGARNQPGQLYLQGEAGALEESAQQIFKQVLQTEDTDAVFFDADGDGDQDLYVASGGNFDQEGALFLQDKLFFNDGAGNFGFQKNSLPRIAINTSVALPLDFDGDGDLDLFVGNRSAPLNYAAAGTSYLLENDGNGRFSDVTDSRADAFANLGLVTDAVWTEMDGLPTLVTVSEWGAPHLFQYAGNEFKTIKSALDALTGWWYTVEAADLDGDGDQDLVLGNRGDNFYFSATDENPAKLWVADFDGNGTTEKIITHRVDGRDMPLSVKRELTNQMPGLKKKSLQHAVYAGKSIQELFPAKVLGQALMYPVTYFPSAIAYAEGGGKFRIEELPVDVQLSCVCGIECLDVNGDGAQDVVLGGNDSGFRPQYSSLDGSFGHVLVREEQGFRYVPNRESGFHVRGEIRDIARLRLNGRPYVLVAVNDQKPQLFALSPGNLN